MKELQSLHKGIVLRAPSPFKTTVVLLDEQLGKIEGFASYSNKGFSLCHGVLISYVPRKRRIKYGLDQQSLVDMPLEWAHNDLFFFHHVLELCSYFLQWDEPVPEVFELVYKLYTDPASFEKRAAQKDFLCDLFTCFGIGPDFSSTTLSEWLKTVAAEFQIDSLRTAKFLEALERYEDCP